VLSGVLEVLGIVRHGVLLLLVRVVVGQRGVGGAG
jgi:hypothetical protein